MLLGMTHSTLRLIVARCCVATSAVLLFYVLAELPAVLGFIDYRSIIPSTSRASRDPEPWEHPDNLLDRELVFIHRPYHAYSWAGQGGLVARYGLPAGQTYHYDARYDSRGFRNEKDIDRAPVVVIGDSFVEGVLVPYASLLTSRLRDLLGVEVANLGHSAYGPQQEFAVLRRFGVSIRPKVMLWVFFEGNDLNDVRRYEQQMRYWDEIVQQRDEVLHQRGGINERLLGTNARLALGRLIEPASAAAPAPSSRAGSDEARKRSCRFTGGQSKQDQTLYLFYAGSALSREDLASLEMTEQLLLLAQKVAAYNSAELALIFAPTTFRVYREFCDFPDGGYGREWQLNDLPARLHSWSNAHNIPYLDLTSPLKEAAARGQLVFFPDDIHWNVHGHEVAANALARFITEHGWLVPSGPTLPDSTFVKRGNSGTIYVIQADERRAFRDTDTFLRYGGAPDLSNVTTLSDAEFDAIPEGMPIHSASRSRQ
jgi:hypothetical protein